MSLVSEERIANLVKEIESNPDVEKVLMLCLAGSHAYGTSTPTSDTDIRGIFIAKKNVIRTPFKNVNELTVESEEDAKVYELNNFIKLFVDMNPNIIELGFTDDESVLYTTDTWEWAKDYLPKLLNTNVAYRFSGYAMSQLKRISGHSKWINNPQPEKQPSQLDFFRLVQSYGDVPMPNLEVFLTHLKAYEGIATLVPFGAHLYGVVPDHREDVQPMFNPDGSIRKLQYEEIPDQVKKQQPVFIVKYMYDEHKLAKEKHHNYWEWVKNRNAARHELEEKYGYDTKHAMHLVRLLRMGEEILKGEGVKVRRPDAQELLDIRNGKFTYDELVSWAEEKDRYITKELYHQSELLKRSNLRVAERMILEAQDSVWDA